MSSVKQLSAIRLSVTGARGAVGIDLEGTPADGQILVKVPGGARKFAGGSTLPSGSVVDSLAPAAADQAPSQNAVVNKFSLVQTDVDARAKIADLLDAGLAGGSDGAGAVGFKRRLLGSVYVPGTVGDRLSKVVFASDWDIVADGTDQLSKIQDMVSNGGGAHYVFPALQAGSTYICNGTVTLPGGVTIAGQNMSSCVIQSNVLNAPIFTIANTQRVRFVNIKIAYLGTPVSGADAIRITNSFFCDFRDVWIENCFNGMNFVDTPGQSSGNHSIIGPRVFRYVNAGIRFENVLDINMSHFRISAFDSINGAESGITLVGGCEGITVSQGDVTLGAGHSITLIGNAGSTARGQSPWYNKFSQMYCDSPKAQAAYLRQASHATFVDCWFASAGHDEAVGFGSALNVAGVDMSQCTHTKFIGGELYGNGGYGALHYSDNKYTLFHAVTLKRNQYSRTANGSGIEFIAASTDFKVNDCIFERDADQTTYRMNVAAEVQVGASDRYALADCLLGGTFMADNGTGTNKDIGRNY